MTSITKSDYPSYRVAKVESMPEAVFDSLDEYWGQLEWISGGDEKFHG